MKTCKYYHEYPDGIRRCPECEKRRHKEWYAKNKEEQLKKSKEWRKENLAIVADRQRKYRASRPDIKHKQYQRWKGRHPLGSTYKAMLDRCCNPRNHAYKDYGGRGLTVSASWLGSNGLENFEMDMGPKPTPHHSLERRDNNRGYSSENCYWGTHAEQGANRRTSKNVTLAGRTQTQAAWARELGISATAFMLRIKKGWPEDKLLSPNSHNKNYCAIPMKVRLQAALRLLVGIIGDIEYEGRKEVEELLSGA